MRRVTLVDRLRYRFDNTMSRGPVALIGWLAILSILLIVAISLFIALTHASDAPLGELMWMSMMRTLDPGTMGGDTGSPLFLFSMFAVTVGGIFIVSTLIGVLTSGIEGKIDELRKGRSFIVERDHTVILGWSPQVFSVISELVIANANRTSACIAILSEKDKVEMEDAIRTQIGDTGRTHVVCRTGSPINLIDLELVNPAEARSIIILSAEAEDPDSLVIKTVLALTNGTNRPDRPYHIVTEIRDEQNLEVARMVARGEAEFILVDELISRISVQTCRQSGLSVVYTELMDFGGDEIYFQEEPGLVGRTFGESLLAYEDSAVMGLRFRDGRVALNPPMDTIIQTGDKVVAVSEDDDTVRLSGRRDYGIQADAIIQSSARQIPPERTLILGWNRRAPTIIHELDSYVRPGSDVLVVADVPEAEEALKLQSVGLLNLHVVFQAGHTTDRRLLDSLGVGSFDHIITLSYFDTLDPQEADARTLVTLLHLRDISERTGQAISIVSEMLDIQNRQLAEVTHADDFIVSDRLTSLLLSQISENKELMAVFEDLFDPEGCELYLKPAEDYVRPGEAVNFYTVVEAARRRGQVAIGYRLLSQAGDASQSYGVRVNPGKSDLVRFEATDKIIVLAED
jgi:hypothetical protein